jgi:NADH-quinone oxidoreductase subunit L
MAGELYPAIALLPLASFVVALTAAAFAPTILPKKGALPGIVATAGSLGLSLWAYWSVSNGDVVNEELLTWVAAGDLELHFGILVDPLSALMLVIVSLVALLVHVFSLGYMNDEGETGLHRYYAELGLFTFSMLAFVFADNILMAFMFFELVGLCSYLLIGFWFREAGPPSAAKKAFLVTRFGDYFFLVGVVGIYAAFSTGRFAGEEGFPHLAEVAIEEGNAILGFAPETGVTLLGLLVLGGVVGKSAQFPLHTWLPDAMEGPTTVSALIHAATMVAAGVYLVARMFGFYALSPTALGVIALIGGFTALFAATMGVVKDDVKQVLAYSTISQYGYMMLGLGAAGYVAGVFHLMNHAFFKALLFLGAGAVIVAMHHEQDMWKMGGLKEHMPVTYYAFLAGSLALAGIVPFSGFWSKDEILFEALNHGLGSSGPVGTLLLVGFAFGLIAVFFTGFYTFRMVLLTFHGEARTETAEDPEPVGWTIKGPLVVLGALATVIGLANMKPLHPFGAPLLLEGWLAGEHGLLTGFEHYKELYEAEQFANVHGTLGTTGELGGAAVSLLLALAGAGLAWSLYAGPDPQPATDRLGGVKELVANNYYQDEFQVWVGEGLTLTVARVADAFDQNVVDGAVNGARSVSLLSGDRIRRLQSGVVSNYASLITTGLVLLLLFFAFAGGWF